MKRVRIIISGLEYQLEQLSFLKVDGNEDGDGTLVEDEASGLQWRYLQTTLSIELAKNRQEEILLERQLLQREKAVGLVSQKKMESILSSQIWRFALSGGDLWRNLKEKLQIEDPSAASLRHSAEPIGIRRKLVGLYKEDDGLESRKQPVNWHADAIEYYSANPVDHGRSKDEGWCHITGTWYHNPIKPTAIVPFHMDANKLAELVFGSIAASVYSPANALLLRPAFYCWLKEYKFVIVPANCYEGMITRWRLDIIAPDEDKPGFLTHEFRGGTYSEQIDGKELTFLGENRPATKFLWFHFLIALVRIKDLGRANWRHVWARYYHEQPFPKPSSYMRRSVVRALATYFAVPDMNVVESWVYNQGFESYHIQDELVKKEIARRVHLLVLEDSGNPEISETWDGICYADG
ncbi:hypothetical protein BBK36DRAFT_1109701 [Trichoderma citrinoviride]|uniref:HNH nuclease domain-containing protein n=1 Tax=Trichoderma citrinoviride TaxID=58853 RepID=A0A2T4BJ93_9HYPO|nr:hypothetical protein BBK36DRAFT_1109701 [Trichoderma citrinoviride]PTB69387.1 hypothetical protein BBK36DRAFT_1109701 [Trichoderma citrinoviride]